MHRGRRPPVDVRPFPERRRQERIPAQVGEHPELDLAALRRLKYDELEKLYLGAQRPNSLSDLNGDADYRRHLAPVLTRRAVLAAAGV